MSRDTKEGQDAPMEITLSSVAVSVPGTSQEQPKERFVVDKQYLGSVYASIKEGMGIAVGNEFLLTYDYNAETVGSLIMTLLWKPNQIFNTKHYLIKKSDNKFQKVEWKPDFIKLKEWATTKQKVLDAKKLYPILFLIQLTIKAKEEMIYHKNTISKDLGLPGWTEIYAEGKAIANKLKKARNLSCGPLLHIHSLKRLESLTPAEKQKLPETARKNIKKRGIDALKRQLISETQRSIVDELAEGKWDNLPLLVASMAVIKPHIEHHYALPPALIVHIKDFKDADMSTEWILPKIKEATMALIKVCPEDWKDPLDQILIHQIFGSWKENLAVMEWAFDRVFDERAKWGNPSQMKNLEVCTESQYFFHCKYFSRPQRGAPRNIGPAQSQQLSNTVVMRGKRKIIDHFSNPEEIVKKMKPSGENLMSKMQNEFKTYQALAVEGTGDWNIVTTEGKISDAAECPVTTCKYFFGTPSAM